MKILMYAPAFPPLIGGPATQVVNLCKTLLLRGESVVVVTGGRAFGVESLDGYPVYRYRWRYTWTPVDKILRWLVVPLYLDRILRNERPDVVHCHSVSVLSVVMGWLARRRGIPTVIKFAGDWVWETLSTRKLRATHLDEIYARSNVARVMGWLEREGLAVFDVIWTVSEFRRKNVEAILGRRVPTRLIPNSLLLPDGGYREEHPGDPAVVVTANRFVPHKRIAAIVRAFARVAESHDKLVLIGVGEEREMQLVRDEIARLGCGDKVSLTGKLEFDEMYRRFAGATLYVSASLEEGLPNVFIEAMHFGLPIVSTDVGGCREMVVEGKTGFLVEPMDEAQLADRMSKLMRNKTLRNTLARNAYHESGRYDLSIVIEEFLDMYRELRRSRR